MRRITLSICGIKGGIVSETPAQREYDTLEFVSDMDSEDHSFSKKTLIKVPTAEITVSSFNVKKQLFSPNSIDVTLTCKGTDNKSLAIIDHIKNFLSKATVNLSYEGIDILRNYFVFSAKVDDYIDTEFSMSFTAYSADKILTLPSLSMSYTNRCITDIADYFVNFNDAHYSYANELDNIFKNYGYATYSGKNDFGKGDLLIAPGKRNKNKFQHLSERDTTTIDNYKTDRTHPTLIQSRESPYDFLCRVCYENGEYFFYEDSEMRFGSGHYHDGLIGSYLTLNGKAIKYQNPEKVEEGVDPKEEFEFKDITGGFNEANPELFANSILINNYIGGTYTKTDGNSDDGDDDITSGTVDKKITIYFNDVAKKYMTGDGLVLEPHMHKPEQDSPIEKYKVFDDRIEIYDYDDKKRNTSGELHLKMRFDANGEQIDKDNASGTYWSIQKKYYIIPYGFTPKEVKLDSTTEEGTKKANHGFNPSIYIYKHNKNWEKPYLQIDFILVGKPEPQPQPQPKPKPQEIIPFEAYESPISINAESITSCEEFLKYNDSSKLNLDQSHTAMLAEKHYKKPVAWIPRIGNLLGQYRLKSAVMKVLTDMSLSFGISLLKAAIAGTAETFKKRKEHQKIQFNTSKNYNIDTYSELVDPNKCKGDDEKPKSPQNEKVTKPISPRTKAETRVDAFNGNKEAHDKLVTLKSQNLYYDIRLGNYFLYRQVFKDGELERGIFCANAVDFEYSSNGYSMTIKAVRRAKVSLMSSDQKKFASDATDEISDSHWCPGIIPPFLSAGSGENGATNGRRIMPNGQNQLVNNTIRIATVVETKGETSSVVKEKVIETTDDGKEIPKIKEDITSLNNNFALGLKKNDCENGTTNTDPLAMGRVRVTFDDEYNAMPSELMPVAKPANGFNFTPRIGDKVLVAYAYGDPDKPFVLCDISANSLGWAYSEKSAVQSRNGHKITFDDPIKGSGWGELLGSILPLPFLSDLFSKVIPDASNKDWNWKNGGITMTDGLGIYKVSMDSGKRNISISSPLGDISLNSLTGIKISAPKGDLNLEGYNINLTAGNNVNITSGKAI
ncbi:MAG: hypothetical protein HUK08_08115, partial [Bacteroidaceae bacterium]|nr:hypothetical protein [Bacteroidaceae bacterium]